MAFAGGWGAQPRKLLRAEHETVGGNILLHAGHALGAGNRGNVVALRQQPGQCYLGRRGLRVADNICPGLWKADVVDFAFLQVVLSSLWLGGSLNKQ